MLMVVGRVVSVVALTCGGLVNVLTLVYDHKMIYLRLSLRALGNDTAGEADVPELW
jgi:hypothetical protein